METTGQEKTEWIELLTQENKDIALKPKNSKGEYALRDFYLCTKQSADATCKYSYPVYATEPLSSFNKDTFILIAKDPEIFKKTYPALKDAVILKSYFNLLGTSDAFLAYSEDNKNSWANALHYADFFNQKIKGRSLEKITFTDNDQSGNWQESSRAGGSPGEKSSPRSTIAEAKKSPIQFSLHYDKKIYLNFWADFELSVINPNNNKIKITWNFGDGHKSYKSKTRHRYAATGKYEASATISDGSEKTVEKFPVEVREFPRTKIAIIQLSPNPKGRDTENEWIKIKNKSKKKINLQDWSVATGWKKLINHPIAEKVIIKPGETKKLTRKHSKFVLDNKKTKLELRYPDGKVATKTKYKNQTSIKENVVYTKENKKWQWIDSSENKNSDNRVVAAKQAKKISRFESVTQSR